eukprot:1186172-Prorocentrum_minimum.AAC.1
MGQMERDIREEMQQRSLSARLQEQLALEQRRSAEIMAAHKAEVVQLKACLAERDERVQSLGRELGAKAHALREAAGDLDPKADAPEQDQ